MVDRHARDILARELKRFVHDEVTLGQFASNFHMKTHDDVIRQMLEEIALRYYRAKQDPSELAEIYPEILPEQRVDFERWILFLHTDIDYGQLPPMEKKDKKITLLVGSVVAASVLLFVVLFKLGGASDLHQMLKSGAIALITAMIVCSLGLVLVALPFAVRNLKKVEKPEPHTSIWPFIAMEDYEWAIEKYGRC